MVDTSTEEKKARRRARRQARLQVEEGNSETSQEETSEEEETSGEEDTVPEDTVPEPSPEPEESTEEETSKELREFQDLCFKVSKVLKEDPGSRLNCRLRVLVPERSAIIYQGLRSNIWGRLNIRGRHVIYRHALLRLLKGNAETEKHFSNL